MSHTKIRIRLKKDVNIRYYDSEEIELDLEKYVAISCATEMGGATVEAMKAQAVAIRTNAYYYARKDQSITDGSPQAFNASRDTSDYQNARDGAKATEGLILYWNNSIAYPASFSASNGGKTVSSKARWGSERPWLQGGKTDPWDYGKPSHGVGMSQHSCSKQVAEGRTYKDVLAFYYDNTYLHNINTGKNIPLINDSEKEGDGDMNAKASDYLVTARKIESERDQWKYAHGHSEDKLADCAGLIKHILEKYGVKSYDGSNTQWRKYLTSNKGKKTDIELRPGMLAFKRRDWTSDQSGNPHYGTSPGDMYHVGMYLGAGKVLEARGTNSGIVVSDISTWTYAGQHINTILDVDDTPVPECPFVGKVTTKSGNLNLRSKPNGSRIGSIPRDEVITLTEASGGWYKTTYNGLTGWVSSDYVTAVSESDVKRTKEYTVYSVSEDYWAEFEQYLTSRKLAFSSKGGI